MMRAAFLAALFAASLLVAAACGGDNGDRSVEGIITDVQSSSLTEIDLFTVRTNDGETIVFRIAPDAHPEPEEGFVPGHLRSHAVGAEQVKVYYREENGEFLATRLIHTEQ